MTINYLRPDQEQEAYESSLFYKKQFLEIISKREINAKNLIDSWECWEYYIAALERVSWHFEGEKTMAMKHFNLNYREKRDISRDAFVRAMRDFHNMVITENFTLDTPSKSILMDIDYRERDSATIFCNKMVETARKPEILGHL